MKQTAQLLHQVLGPEYVSYRRGQGNQQFAYLESHEVIRLLNTIFGWSGWSSNIAKSEIDYVKQENGRWNAGVAVTVRLIVPVREDGGLREVYREDTGWGSMDNGPSESKAVEKARKHAVTDGIRRTARQFGDLLGSCLYDKQYLSKIKTMRRPGSSNYFAEECFYRKDAHFGAREGKCSPAGQDQVAVKGELETMSAPHMMGGIEFDDDEFGEEEESYMLACAVRAQR